MRATLALAALGLALAGCQGGGRTPPTGATAVAPDWRAVATREDRTRLREWRDTWLRALAAAKGQDDGAIGRDRDLFGPDLALADAMPPAGDYRCRVVKLGAQDAFLPAFAVHPVFPCTIGGTGTVAQFRKVGGSQRFVGRIFADGPHRAIYLGTLVLADESGAQPYGRDAKRDMAGIVTRIGPRRWRLALPAPGFESQLDLIELIPAT